MQFLTVATGGQSFINKPLEAPAHLFPWKQ